ncbi:MAG: T9SS type A sorting domain-containing protein [Bacteroidales bacterium]|nr:T9SS type A sorting domain-containing protein [Bacteroidales bacterium]
MKKSITLFLLLSSVWLMAQPVAVDDAVETTQGDYFTTLSVGVLNNDMSPVGEAIRIHSITRPEAGSATFTSDTIYYSTAKFSGFFGADSLKYRVCLVSDSNIISNWATVRINILPDSLHPITYPDYGEADLGLWKTFDVLANDISLNGEPIRLNSFKKDNMLVEVKLNTTDPNHLKLDVKPLYPDTIVKIAYYASVYPLTVYRVVDTLFVTVRKGHAVEKMNINNISTYVNADAILFGSPYVSAAYESTLASHCYEVPAGSGKGTFFSVSPWMGGLAQDGTIHLAAERYRQLGQDFHAGAISNPESYAQQPDSITQRVYYATKEDILFHLSHYNTPGYNPAWCIQNWPGNGDPALGQNNILAPFQDVNENGLYEPLLGDYPKIRGDASAFYIFNDGRSEHTESGGIPMKAEFHCMVYAFNRPDDSLLNNTLFIHYDIYNRSVYQYHSTMFGFWADMDLGYGGDDYTGTDVSNGFFYTYNAQPIDGSGESSAYGPNPPIQSVAFLGGALMDFDGEDNPKSDETGEPVCGEAINGLGFGDGIADNERMGMTNSIFSASPSNIGVPLSPLWYYSALRSYNEDGTPMLFGGQGTLATGASGPAARFMFPGETDPLNWGTGCQPPNTTEKWTETTAGSSTNQDKRCGASTGPFTFKPGDCQQIDLALVTTWNTANPAPLASLGKMQQYVATLRTCFEADSVPGGGTFSGNDVGIATPQQKPTMNLVIYPNPAGDYINVKGLQGQHPVEYRISDLSGKTVISGRTTTQPLTINTRSLNSGLYILSVSEKHTTRFAKFVKE